MLNPDAERNLLFVLLALQMDFVDGDQLVVAMQQWMLDRSQALGDVLVRQGVLSERRRELLDEMVREHIQQHGGDVEKSLAAASSKDPTGTEVTSAFLPDLPGLLATMSVAADQSHRPRPGREAGPNDEERLAGGRFRVLELHAKGGLGQVMKARDEELGRTVAVKEIQPQYAEHLTAQDRFVLEAEITGGLEHPSIVPVYGLGKYSDGQPYYAMRFVRGDDLSHAIKRFHAGEQEYAAPGARNVRLLQLLRRFTDVCNAVQYAHSRGVLHRDIKPGNVMLGKYGETLVVDWGLAKVVGRTESGAASDEPTLLPSSGGGSSGTLVGSAIGTPAYMSPEQAAGDVEQLGPASDVYSLGATLYCVLTGRPAFTGSAPTALDRVKKADFAPPRVIKPEIPRPLEAICLKAMALSPSDRYGSPRELVDDIEHWIADERVSAYRESRSERVARWMRRHRTWVQAGAATLTTATVLFAVASVLVTRAWTNESAARQEAVAYFQDAREAVDEWLTGVAQALQYYPGTEKPRERLLERAVGEYEAFTRRRPGHRDLELERGRTYLRLGHLRVMLGDATGATEAYESAIGVFEALKWGESDDWVCQIELANCRTNQGVVSMLTGRISEADQGYQGSIAELERLLDRFPGNPLARQALATALTNRGELLLDTGELEVAEDVLRKSIDLLTGLSDERRGQSRTDLQVRPDITDGPGDPSYEMRRTRGEYSGHDTKRLPYELSLVKAQDLLGRVLLKQGQYAQAVQEMQDAVESSAALAENAWDNPESIDSRAATNVSLGTALREMGDYDGEAAAYRLAVADYRMLLKALPGAPQFRESLALTLTDLGSLSYKRERADEAVEHLKEAQRKLRDLAAEYPLVARYSAEWAYCHGTLARLVRDRGRFEEAKVMLEEAIQAFQNVLPASGETMEPVVLKYLESLALCQAHLGETFFLMGHHDDADAAFQAAVDTLAGAPDKPPGCRDILAVVYEYWGNALCDAGKHDDAREKFNQANDTWAALVSSGAASADHRHNYARFLTRCPISDFRDAEAAIKVARELTDRTPKNAMYWNTLAISLYRNGDWQASLDALQRAMANRPAENGRDCFFLAMAKWQLNDKATAAEAYQRGVEWLEKTLPHNPDLFRIQREAAELLEVDEKKEAD